MRRALAGLAALLAGACGGGVAGPDMTIVLADAPAPLLADYGLFIDAAGRRPVAGVVAYDLINPLFSDHADKHRYVYVPDGKAATYRADDVLDFPVGSVLVKTFAYGERFVETRLLIHKSDGWAAFPYVWDEAGRTARYSPVGARIDMAAGDAGDDLPAFTYSVPNKNQCKTCHQSGDALTPIGPKIRNLNHDGPYGANQLIDWSARGLVTGVPQTAPMMPEVWDTSLSLENRARAYLDINCAHCHKARGSASNSGLWLDWDVFDPVKIGVGKHPTAAGRGAGTLRYVIVPGDSDGSILSFRMASGEAGIAMPELGRALIDEAGVDLVRAWIDAMPPDGSQAGDAP